MSKRRTFGQGRWAAAWRWLPGLLLLTLGACTDPTNLDAGLQNTDDGLDVLFTDTLTVRTSTVLNDSLASSLLSNVLFGRYADSRLGTVEARGFLRLGLSTAFVPATSMVYDSLVLVLTPDTYRYGDTTRTQHLAVHLLQENFVDGKTYYTSDALTYDSQPVGERDFRARTRSAAVRVRLNDALGRQLFTAGQNGLLNSNLDLLPYLPGLALLPGNSDNAALLRFVTTTDTQLALYYHDANDLDTQASVSFTAADGAAHFYRLRADRQNTLLAPLTGVRQAIGSSLTAEETYVQAGLGIQTKIEIPYLQSLRELGGEILIENVELQLETVRSSENRYLPPPASLVPRLTDSGNRGGAFFADNSGATVTAGYQQLISARTGLEQGTYLVPLTGYVQSVLKRSLDNTGVLLEGTSIEGAERVVLGSARNTSNPLRLKVYFTRISR